MLNSCEKNAAFLGLDANRLSVHASAHKGAVVRRRRRKAKFGSRMKNTNIEMMLIEHARAAGMAGTLKEKAEGRLDEKMADDIKQLRKGQEQTAKGAAELKRQAERYPE